MVQVSKPREANQSMTEESGRPGTVRSKVGCDAIDEPCTKRTVPCFAVAAAFAFCQRKSRTSPFLVQCSRPFNGGCGATARFIDAPAKRSKFSIGRRQPAAGEV